MGGLQTGWDKNVLELYNNLLENLIQIERGFYETSLLNSHYVG